MSVANFMQLVLMDDTLWTKALKYPKQKDLKQYANATLMLHNTLPGKCMICVRFHFVLDQV